MFLGVALRINSIDLKLNYLVKLGTNSHLLDYVQLPCVISGDGGGGDGGSGGDGGGGGGGSEGDVDVFVL